jgi:hypothetical protein
LGLLQPGDKLLGGIVFKIPDNIRQSVTGNHQVQMVFQDDLGMDLQAFMLAAKPEGVDEKVKIGFPGEEGNPFDHRTGDEVGDAGLSDGIAASHRSRGDQGAKQSFAGK